ncbi:homocysteine S-methyltransferase family protein [filamentous cyanobacterium LEGE 11480]|uniref:Homocysteine S-methyltransferase family protein n=1 Tax=Romeriopsis navalis LEGE 11480 TaxID=2777977 RepID=A0A928VLU5_9CYAN|nr:homocysteine S-methyltransferase family protein [Romeriopsis navalis]MBE9029006.1 homocysteine S-methyltransferase family protein [Romeriopsis navalis LEGE 11480]
MAQYRNRLPQLSNSPYLTDSGMETTLIFREGIDLPEFASFDLLKHQTGYEIIARYYRTYAVMAQNHKVGLILESPTWRANSDWGMKLGYSREALAEMNRQSISLLQQIRQDYATEQSPMVISGCIGPRGDGYMVEQAMTTTAAAAYHRPQIEIFRDTAADFVSAFTINYVEEAIGIVQAAQTAEMPVVISFTLETDGNLPTGQTLKSAIEQVDQVTNNGPIYYMINCVHPTHFEHTLIAGEPWLERIQGLRANASVRSHAELDVAEDLDDGNPAELGHQYRELIDKLPNLNIFGGCCGTDERHVESICRACLPVLWAHLSSNQLAL